MTCRGAFRVRRRSDKTYYKVQSLKSKVGLAAAKAAALRINIDSCGIVASPMHAPSRAPVFSHTYIRIYVCILYVCMYACMYVVVVCMYLHTYICMHVCMLLIITAAGLSHQGYWEISKWYFVNVERCNPAYEL